MGSHESMTTNLKKRPIPVLSFLKTPYFGETMATATMIPAVPPESTSGYLGVTHLLKRSYNVSSYNVGSPASGAGQVNGQYHRPPAALATAEAAPIASSGSGLEPIWEVPSEN